MSSLHFDVLTLPAADLGADNLLPQFKNIQDLHEITHFTPDIPADMRENIGYGRLKNLLPYTTQDGYDRVLKPRDFRVAVLENDILKATFMLELGGRLWSLFHKPTGRELLAVNPVFQPANLALRNAWFSGGVEWNIGTTGHTPFTCAPLFAARVDTPEGIPILRMYEWERVRQVPFQIDCYLPDGSPMLFVQVRINNPHDHAVPMYWWSNMAAPETPDTRVLAPAAKAYRFGYADEGLRLLPIPVIDGIDTSYTTRSARAFDLFFHVPDEQYAWITALDGQGKGVVQVSTQRLRGRKLFLWGQGKGGKNWQRFLSPVDGAKPYLEIQAGLARTQLEHLAMPAHAEWSWLEGYGLLEADATAIHSADWSGAVQQVQTRLNDLMSEARLNAEYQRAQAWLNLPPTEIIQRGSGWGALERLRRAKMGEAPFCSPALVFDDESLGELQTAWRRLLEDGAMPDQPFTAFVAGYMVQAEWKVLLQAAVQAPNVSWLAWLHLGIMHYQDQQWALAEAAWGQSQTRQINPFALRGLALLKTDAQDWGAAAEYYAQALQLDPSSRALALEAGQALLQSGQAQRWLDLAKDLPDSYKQHGRIVLLRCQAAFMLHDLQQVEKLLDAGIQIVDLREGEDALTQLWIDFHAHRVSLAEGIANDANLRERVVREHPLPVWMDYRMGAHE